MSTLEGHSDRVTSLAWSHDATKLASGAANLTNSLRIWDLASGQCSTLEGDGRCVIWPHGAPRLIYGLWDFEIRVWDPTTGQHFLTFIYVYKRAADRMVDDMVLSPDATRLAVLQGDTVTVLDATTNQDILSFEESHVDLNDGMIWSHNSTQLATISGASTAVKIWDLATGQPVLTLKTRKGAGWVTWSYDMTRLAVAQHNTIEICSIATGQRISILEGHTSIITFVAWSRDPTRLASASRDGTIRIWDPTIIQDGSSVGGRGNIASEVAWSPDATRLASLSGNTIKIWDLKTGQRLSTLQGRGEQVSSLTWSSDLTRLAVRSGDDTAEIWDPATGQCVSTLEVHGKSVKGSLGGRGDVGWSSDMTKLASVSGDSTIEIWDVATGRCISTLEGHDGPVNTLYWSHDTTRLASASDDHTIKIWDPATGQCVSTLTGHCASVDTAIWSSDATQILSSSKDDIKKWDLATGRCTLTLDTIEDVFDDALKVDEPNPNLFLIRVGEEMVRHFKHPKSEADVARIIIDFLDSRNGDVSSEPPTSLVHLGYSISPDRCWITHRGENLLWLPPGYRPAAHAVASRTALSFRRNDAGCLLFIFGGGNPLLWK